MDTIQLDEAIAASKTADPLTAFVAPDVTTASPAWPDGLPQPGIYQNVPYEVYRAWPAVNSGMLKILLTVNPLHAKAYMDGLLDRDTPDRKKGRAFHTSLLEPALYAERFPIAGECSAILASGARKGSCCGNQGTHKDAAGKWFCGTHCRATNAVEVEAALSLAAAEEIAAMKQHVFAHPVVKMLRQNGGYEVSFIWSADGIACKGRADKMILDQRCPDTLIDAKKIQPCSGTEHALQSAIVNYGYALQAAFYVSGIRTLRPDKQPPLWCWLFQEDKPPYDTRPCWASRRMLAYGNIQVERSTKLYRFCLENDRWPGYASDVEEIEPPDWIIKRYSL